MKSAAAECTPRCQEWVDTIGSRMRARTSLEEWEGHFGAEGVVDEEERNMEMYLELWVEEGNEANEEYNGEKADETWAEMLTRWTISEYRDDGS